MNVNGIDTALLNTAVPRKAGLPGDVQALSSLEVILKNFDDGLKKLGKKFSKHGNGNQR